MESAGVAELKARPSEYLSRVKAGEEVLVTDRGRPVARLVPAGVGGKSSDEVEEARLGELEREGLVRRGSGGLAKSFFARDCPADSEGLLRKAVLEKREESP